MRVRQRCLYALQHPLPDAPRRVGETTAPLPGRIPRPLHESEHDFVPFLLTTANGRSGGARTRTSIAYGRTTGDHEELRVSRSGFPTIRSPVDGAYDIRVTAYRKLGYQIGRCRMTGKAVRLLNLGSFPSAHLLALSFFSRCSSRSPRSPPRRFVGCGCLSVLHHGA